MNTRQLPWKHIQCTMSGLSQRIIVQLRDYFIIPIIKWQYHSVRLTLIIIHRQSYTLRIICNKLVINNVKIKRVNNVLQAKLRKHWSCVRILGENVGIFVDSVYCFKQRVRVPITRVHLVQSSITMRETLFAQRVCCLSQLPTIHYWTLV